MKTLKRERIVFTVTGLGLVAIEWKDCLRYRIDDNYLSDVAHNALITSDYKESHRLEVGREYHLVLVFGESIPLGVEMSTVGIKYFASCEFGERSVIDLKAELAILIRNFFTNVELEAMGVEHLVVLHKPIVTEFDGEVVLLASRVGGQSWVIAFGDSPNNLWGRSNIAFAFLELD